MRPTQIHRTTILAAAASILLGAPFSAGAQTSDWVQPGAERYTLTLGAFLPAFDTDARVDNSSLGTGSSVNLKDDLGIDGDEQGAVIGAEWRFLPRHRIAIGYARFSPSGTVAARRNIQIGDEIFPAGATLSTELKLTLLPITYSYSFIKSSQQELALTLGLQWQRLQLKSVGSASLSGLDATADVDAKANLPLPLIGLRWDYHFSPRWSAGLSGGAFSLKVGKDTFNADGTIWSGRAYGEYRFSRNFGVGVALESLNLDVDANDDQWKGALDYSYWGPQLYLKARF